MVFILAASSLNHALATLTQEEKERYKDKIFSVPGLSLNPNTKKSSKNCSKLACKGSQREKRQLYGMTF